MEPSRKGTQSDAPDPALPPDRERELRGMLAAAQALSRNRTFAAAARAIFDHCRELIGAPAGYISLANPAGDANEVVFLEAGGLPCSVDPLAPMPIRGLRAEAYRTGQTVCENDFSASRHQRFLPDGHVALENVLFAPLKAEGQTVGLLGLANKPGGFTEDDCRLASGFAELAAVALLNNRAEEAVRRSQAHLRLIADSLPVLIAYADREGRLGFVNRQYEQWFGVAPEQVLGLPVSQALGPELARQLQPILFQTLAGQPTEWETPLRLPNGQSIHWHIRFLPHRGEGEEVLGCFLLAEDISFRKIAEQRLTQAHDSLELRVAERTAELRWANEQLREEMAQRQEAEARLRDSENRYRSLLKTAASFVVSLSPDGRILEFNDEAERLSGWRREEVQGRDVFSLLLKPENLPRAREEFARIRAGEVVRSLEFPILLKNGGERFLLWNASLIRDAAGQPAEILVVGQDVTERREAQAAVEMERRRLFSLLDHLPAYVFLQAPDYRVKFANRFFRENFGEPRGRPCHEILWGRDQPCTECPTNRVFHTGTPHVWEWTRPDGRTFQIHDYPFADWDGSPLVLEMGIDITARVRAEEAQQRLTAILEATSDFVGVTDVSGTVLYINQAGRRMLGLPLKGNLAGMHFLQCHPPWAQTLLMQEALPTARAQGLWQGETAFLDRDGREVPVSQVVIVHRDPGGKEQFYSTIARDITERRQTEAQLRLLTSQLLSAQEEERRRLSRELHDELGQSLLVLKMQLRNIERRATDSAMGEDCARILGYLDAIVENVRRLSRDLSPSVLEDLGLSAALRHLVEEFRRHPDFQVLEAEVESVDEFLGPEAQTNLYRVFQEALTNVGKHAGASRVVIRLQHQGNRIIGSVEDDGRGMEAALLPAGKQGGCGMGLATMTERLRMLGGTLELKSQPGRGTSIRFSLPIHREPGSP
jgi:PAS domain S-box-containing protein